MEKTDREISSGNVLITGGSSGIGYELSRIFAAEGYDLILVARHENRLKEVKQELENEHGIRVKTVAMDLSDPDEPIRLYTLLTEENLVVDMLVNNAGFGLLGDFRETPLEKELALLRVNEIATLILTKLFLPGMLERKRGRILNVASTASFLPGPRMAVYYASKSNVLYLSEALAIELKNSGVTVSVVCPGPTDTGFQARAGQKGARLLRFSVMQPDKVARIAYRGMMKGRNVIIPGFLNKMSAVFGRYLPHSVTLPIVKFLHGKQ